VGFSLLLLVDYRSPFTMDLRSSRRSTVRPRRLRGTRRPLPRLSGPRASAASGRFRVVHQLRGL